MRQILLLFTLLALLFSQFNLGLLYAQSITQLEAQKDASIEVLDKTEIVVDKVIEKLDEKINDEREERLREKEKEIGQYIEDVQEKIEKENSGSDVKKLVSEAKKVVVLKVVSGATEYEDVTDNIPNDVAKTYSEKKQAKKVIQESLETSSGDYSIMIKTKYPASKLKSLFDKFDTNISLEFMYKDDNQNYFEVFIDEDSIFRQEMLEDIGSGNLPETFFGVDIIFPEVFSIGSLEGEDISKTWGVESYGAYNYLDKIDSSASVKVGVVDTGIDYNHPDLSSNVSSGYDFVNDDSDAMDDQGHGTHVAGTIAANINGSGIIGVNPKADLVPLKICNASGFCPSYAVLRALDYATQERVDILNMSLGGRGTVAGHPICAGISAYTDAGGIVVSASGNSNIDTSQFVPGGCTDAITVAAVDSSGDRASFSNYGSKVDVAAPGVSVYSTYPGNNYRSLSGTSMAAPHISGLVSLIKSENPDVSASQVKTLLKSHPEVVQTTGGKIISSAVDVESLMSSFSEAQLVEEVGEEVVEEANQEIISIQEEEISTGDDVATIDKTIDFETMPEIMEINLNPDGIVINNDDESAPVAIEEIVEKTQEIDLEGFTRPESGSIEINSDDLPDINVNEAPLSDFDTTSRKEIYITGEDGTTVEKSDIEINSINNFEEELIPFETDIDSERGFISPEKKEVNLSEEQGVKINNNESLESVEQVAEQSEGILNSLYQDDEAVSEETRDNNNLSEPKTLMLPGIGGAQGIDINSLPNEELEDIDEVIDSIDQTISISSTNSGSSSIIEDNCTINLGGSCNFNLNAADEYNYLISDINKVSLTTSTGSFAIQGSEEGKTTISMEKDNETYHEISVEVIPAHATHTQIFDIGETLQIQVLDADKYDFSVSTGSIITYKGNSREVHVTAMREGSVELYLRYKGLLVHTLEIEINSIPTPEELSSAYTLQYSIREGGNVSWSSSSAQRYTYSVSQGGIIKHYTSYRRLTMIGLKQGNVTIYGKDTNGVVRIAFSIEVTENTSPQRVRCDIMVGGSCDISLNNADIYDYTVSRLGHISYAKNSTLVRVTGENAGSTILYIKKVDGTLVYQVDMYVKTNIKTYDIDLFEGQDMMMYLRSAYNHNYTMSKKGIVGLYTNSTSAGGNWMYIKGYQEGNVQLHIQRGSWMIILNINVREKPKEYECEIEVGMRCYLNLYRDHNLHKYVRFSIANYDVIQQTWWRTDVGDQATIIGIKEGIGHFSVTGIDDGKTHHLKVKVVPKNTLNVEGECDLDIGGTCRINLRDTGDYEVTVSNPGIVSAFRYSNQYDIYGDAEGETELYIKKDGVIVHTIHLNVGNIRNLTLGTYRMDVEAGEEDYFIITSGNGDYRIYKDNDNISIYATSDEGRYRVYANRSGTTKVMIYDRENRYSSFTVYVTGDDEGTVYEDDAEIINSIEADDIISSLLGEISVANVGDNIEINNLPQEAYFHWKKGRLLTRYETTTSVYLKLLKLESQLISVENYKLFTLLDKISTVSNQSEYSSKPYQDFFELLTAIVKYELEKRDTQVQLDELKARVDLALVYGELGFEVTGFNELGQGWGGVAAYWTGYFTNDAYLQEAVKDDLKGDLAAAIAELNPSKKWKKFKLLGEAVSKINKVLFKIKKKQIDGGIIFDSTQIHDPLYSGVNGKWVKKAHYDTDIGRDFHWMEKIDGGGSLPTGTRRQIKVK